MHCAALTASRKQPGLGSAKLTVSAADAAVERVEAVAPHQLRHQRRPGARRVEDVEARNLSPNREDSAHLATPAAAVPPRTCPGCAAPCGLIALAARVRESEPIRADFISISLRSRSGPTTRAPSLRSDIETCSTFARRPLEW